MRHCIVHRVLQLLTVLSGTEHHHRLLPWTSRGVGYHSDSVLGIGGYGGRYVNGSERRYGGMYGM